MKARFVNRAVSGLTLVLFAGCSGAGGTPSIAGSRSMQTAQRESARPVVTCRPPPRAENPLPAFPKRFARGYARDSAEKAGGPTIFVSDGVNGLVYVYGPTGNLTATLETGAYSDSLAVDKLGNLYVPAVNGASVLVYATGYQSAPTTLDDRGEQPSGVAVDPSGNVAVANYQTAKGGPGDVAFYAKGQLAPSKTVSSTTFQQVFYAAFDRSGNLYVDGMNSACDVILGEIVGGIAGSSITPLEVDNSLNYGGTLAVDRAGDIVVDGGPYDGFSEGEIRLFGYAPPKAGRLGAAKFVVNLLDAGDGFSFAFDAKNAHVWTADEAHENVQEWNFPAGGFALDTWQNPNGNQALGIAVAPSGSP